MEYILWWKRMIAFQIITRVCASVHGVKTVNELPNKWHILLNEMKKKFHKWLIQFGSHSLSLFSFCHHTMVIIQSVFYNLLYIILFWEMASNHQILCTDFNKKKKWQVTMATLMFRIELHRMNTNTSHYKRWYLHVFLLSLSRPHSLFVLFCLSKEKITK